MEREFAAGWRVLLAAALGSSVATTAIPLYSMGVFVTPLEVAKGWSRSDVTTAAAIFSFCLPPSVLILGYLIERFGVRRLVVTGHVILGLAFFGLSVTGDSLYVFWGLYATAALLAAGASPVAYSRAVIEHFDRRRGLAIGIFMASAGIGAALAPPLLHQVIRAGGWQAGYQALAATLFVIAAAVFLLLSNVKRPGRAAAQPPAPAAGGLANDQPQLHGLPAPPVLLVLICLVIFAVALSVNGYVVHLVPLLQGEGMTASAAAMIASFIGLAVISGRLITGALMDRISTGLIGFVVFSVATCGILLLQHVGASAAALASFMLGFAVGAEVDLVTYLVSRAFPPSSFARSFSWVYGVFMIGSGLSPLIAGQVFDRTGGYDLFFSMTAGLLTAVSLAFMALHLVVRRRHPETPGPSTPTAGRSRRPTTAR